MSDYVKALHRAVKQSVAKRIVGKEETVDLAVITLLCGGHMLIDDVPGTGKTELSKAIADSLSLSFKRIQCVPDLLPSDITGVSFFDMKQSEFRFQKGPVFTNILLADEINRAMPKTQAGLLECMQEKQVTVDGETYSLDFPFMVIATQNPVETRGTYALPEAQLDRFFMRADMGYPTREESISIVRNAILPSADEENHTRITREMLVKASGEVMRVRVHDDIIGYASDICERTRGRGEIVLGASPRALIHLVRAAQGFAAIDGREFVLPDDVKRACVPVLAHRMVLANSLFGGANDGKRIIEGIVSETTVPSEDIDFSRV